MPKNDKMSEFAEFSTKSDFEFKNSNKFFSSNSFNKVEKWTNCDKPSCAMTLSFANNFLK